MTSKIITGLISKEIIKRIETDLPKKTRNRSFLKETLRTFGYEERDVSLMKRPEMVQRIESSIESEKHAWRFIHGLRERLSA